MTDFGYILLDFLLHAIVIGGLGIFFMGSAAAGLPIPQYVLGVLVISAVLSGAEYIMEAMRK